MPTEGTAGFPGEPSVNGRSLRWEEAWCRGSDPPRYPPQPFPGGSLEDAWVCLSPLPTSFLAGCPGSFPPVQRVACPWGRPSEFPLSLLNSSGPLPGPVSCPWVQGPCLSGGGTLQVWGLSPPGWECSSVSGSVPAAPAVTTALPPPSAAGCWLSVGLHISKRE